METPDLIRTSTDTQTEPPDLRASIDNQTEPPDLIRASTDTKTEPALQTHVICLYGDLLLRLETPTAHTTYRVSTHLLCSASPVFRDCIPSFGSGWGSDSSLREITQPDPDGAEYELDIDYEAALRVNPAVICAMLYAIHGRLGELPETVTYEFLHDLAELCHHYQCAEALAPWVEIWMKSPELEKLVLLPGYEEWLYIACIFGLQEAFGRVTQRLAKNVVRDDDGNIRFFVAGEVKQLPRFLNTALPRDIEAQHAKAFEAILLICRQIYDTYHDDETVKCKHGQKHCDNIVFAYLHMELEQLGLLDAYTRIEGSAYEKKPLASVIETFGTLWGSIQHSLEHVMIADQNHSGCIEPPTEKVKIFDPCLEGIAQLPVDGYRRKLHPSIGELRTPSGPPTWDGVLDHAIDISNNGRPRMPTSKHNKYITICAFGDLDIRFNSIEVEFRVSSHVVRTASPFLHRLIKRSYGFNSARGQLMHFRRNTPRNTLWIMEAHDPKAVAVLFFALHGQEKGIPDDIASPSLYELAVLSEKFQCTQVLRPWFCRWMDRLGLETAEWNLDNLLYIAWVFEFDIIFQSLTRTFITKAAQGVGQPLTIDNDTRPVELCAPIPHELTWEISSLIGDTITEIELACRELYGQYKNPESDTCILWGTSPPGKVCSRLIFAELYRGLKSINFLSYSFISIPRNISLQTITRDIDRVLKAVVEVPKNSRLRIRSAFKDHSACIQLVRASNEKIQTIFREKKLDLAMCAHIKEKIARRSKPYDSDDSDY